MSWPDDPPFSDVMASGACDWMAEEQEADEVFDFVSWEDGTGGSVVRPPGTQRLMYQELLMSPRFGNGALRSVRLRTLIAICDLLEIRLTRADRRRKQKVIDRLESQRESVLVRCSQSRQLAARIQCLIVEQTVSTLLARNNRAQGVGAAIRARLCLANGSHVFPTDIH
jgi:hypothetical protein